MNTVNLIGRLVRDPESRVTTTQVVTTSFTLAVDRKFKDKSGNKLTDFLSVVCWRTTAEFVVKYAVKGTMVSVVGEIQTRNYDDKDGKKVYVTEVVADEISILAGWKGSDKGGGFFEE